MLNYKKLSLAILSLFIILFSGCSSPSFGNKKVEKKYYTGGQVRSSFTWSDKTGKNGVQRTFGYEGEITSSVKITNSVKNGIMTFYDAKGRVIKQTPYVNGFIEGIEQEFYPNGDRMVTYTYTSSKKNGAAFSYYPNGEVHSKAMYKDNKLIN